MPGSDYLDASEYTDTLIEKTQKNGGKIAAICAAPYVLGKRNLLSGKKATCYPNEKFISQLKGAEYIEAPVVTDGNITTSSGMGNALLFGCELLSLLKGKEVADNIAKSALIK